MATTFYLPQTGAAAVSPTYSAGWEQTGAADRIAMVRIKDLVSTALTNRTVTVPITTSQQILSRQYVSEPMAANVNINGIFKIVIRCSESSVDANVNFAYTLRVFSNDGSTERAVLISGLVGVGAEFATTAATKFTQSAITTSYTTVSGDRIVLEIGLNATTPATAQTAIHRYGTSANSNFAYTTGLTTDLNPICEFDSDLFEFPMPNNYKYVKVGEGMATTERFK